MKINEQIPRNGEQAGGQKCVEGVESTEFKNQEALIEQNVQGIAHFSALTERLLETPAGEPDPLVPTAEYSHEHRAISLLRPDEPEFQRFLSRIYAKEYPTHDLCLRANTLARDVNDLNRLAFAANNRFRPASGNICGKYNEFDARFLVRRINGEDNHEAIHPVSNGDNSSRLRQETGMCRSMRLVGAIITPVKIKKELLDHRDSSNDVYAGIQDTLRLSDADMWFAAEMQKQVRADCEWHSLSLDSA